MPIARLLSRRHIEIALAYLAGYVLLDWLSYVHPFAGFGITPWNPPTTAYQALMVVLSLTGLAVGVLVSEQQRTQAQLRSTRRR